MGGSRWRMLIFVLILHIIGYLVFLKGFFPSKVVIPGFNQFHRGVSPFIENNEEKFDKLILVVVDALRSDFLFSEDSHMEFVHHLVRENCALPFTAYSNPPTVTLPRLKGITTGGTPSFLDAILNIADDNDNSQSLINYDSWVHQFHNKLKVLNFFGDDTWLKLFPPATFFNEFEGTNSFFVNDFTEVDNNVTRHLDDGLLKSHWDGLILHYLGLDHIGHKGGPKSMFMPGKQREMDAIIKRLYNETVDSNTLMVVMGDHGMNEVGNHGGSSAGETNPGLLFVSPQFQKLNKNLPCPVRSNEDFKYYEYINQIDLVPTLASLLNFPIPKNSLGIFIRDLLTFWGKDNQKSILAENCEQLMDLFKAKYTDSSEVDNKWEALQGSDSMDAYYDFLLSIQSLLASSATEYGYKNIYIGIAILLVSTVLSLMLFNWHFLRESSLKHGLFFMGLTVFYSIHFHASSLIEEEHQIWWYFSIIGLISLFIANRMKSGRYFLIILISLRIIRTWCNTGQKFTSPYTFSGYLLQNIDILWILNILTYFATAVLIYSQGSLSTCFTLKTYFSFKETAKDFGSLVAFVMTFVTCSISLLFKLCQYFNDGKPIPIWLNGFLIWTCLSYGIVIDPSINNQLHELNVQLSKLSFCCIIGIGILRIALGRLRKMKYGLLTDLSNLMTLFLIHQSRAEIIPIFLTFYVIKFLMAKLLINNELRLQNNIDQFLITMGAFTLCLQNLSFFSMGNTNLLATVDLSNSYNGFKSYDVFLVGALTFFSNFSGPIFWSLTSLQLFFENRVIVYDIKNSSRNLINLGRIKSKIVYGRILVGLVFYSISALNLVGSCFNLRFHLFIWTVFSPKLLFFASWSILMNLTIETISVIALFALD